MTVYEVAKEINRLLNEGIEIHPSSPIHEKLNNLLKPKVESQRRLKQPKEEKGFFQKWDEAIKQIKI
jgi:hypothetical protein